MAFSDNLRKARKRLHKSQTALSGETGVSVAAICKYESGMMLPNVITGAELARALGVTVEALVTGKEMKNDEGNDERKQTGDM